MLLVIVYLIRVALKKIDHLQNGGNDPIHVNRYFSGKARCFAEYYAAISNREIVVKVANSWHHI